MIYPGYSLDVILSLNIIPLYLIPIGRHGHNIKLLILPRLLNQRIALLQPINQRRHLPHTDIKCGTKQQKGGRAQHQNQPKIIFAHSILPKNLQRNFLAWVNKPIMLDLLLGLFGDQQLHVPHNPDE